VRGKWGVADRDVVILFCAKLQPWKRPSDLLQAFAKVNAANATLVMVGDGPLRASLIEEAAGLGIGERVKFVGFANQTELPATYSAADLMVLPSVYDAFGVVVNEAMLCGCAVAASDHVGAARDLIEHERTGYVFPCGDVDALAAILRRACGDPEKLAGMGEAARARMDSWSPRQNIDATVEAIARGAKRAGREEPSARAGASQSVSADSNLPPAAKFSE
jgi:glycosyltransferase involved in cell wall biosynthesis